MRVIGSRKILIGAAVIVIGVAMDLSMGLSSNLLYLLTAIGSAMMVANVGAKFAHAKAEAAKPQIPTAELVQAMQEIHNITSRNAQAVETYSKSNDAMLKALQFLTERAKL